MSHVYRCAFCGSTSNPIFTSSTGDYICSLCMHNRHADRYDGSRDHSDNITYAAKRGTEKE